MSVSKIEMASGRKRGEMRTNENEKNSVFEQLTPWK
jgi:hypothetical protein